MRWLLDRDLVDSLVFGAFVVIASGEWVWGFVASWGFLAILSRFAELRDLIQKRDD